jgi:hypothetical protein
MKRFGITIGGMMLALSSAIPMFATADQSFDVHDVMSAQQFHDSGLEQLSAAQIRALDAVIVNISVAAAANNKADLEDILTAKEFRDDGLEKLSSDQLAALNAWLNSYLNSEAQAAPADVTPAGPAPTASIGASELKDTSLEPDSIETTIPGKFTGWTGDTVFKLGNGQVWRQAEPSVYTTKLQDPAVIIKRLHVGYLLTVKGQGQAIFVVRVH